MGFIVEQLLETNLEIDPNEINNQLENTIKQKLKNKLEGLCFEDGYIVKDSVKIISKSMGKIVINDNKSCVRYVIKYKAGVISPSEGDVMDTYISNINKMGVISYIRIKETDKSEDSPIVVMIPRDYFNESIYNVDDLHIGQKISVEVVGCRIKYLSDKIQVIAKCYN